MDQYERFLAFFPGPKGESGQYVKGLFDRVLDDYFHWRRNYYPADGTLVSPVGMEGFQRERSDLDERVDEMLSRLRRSFPFYSPRYIAHQQGETTIPALVGSLAGLLYNSNNVTSETGAVTVEYEIDACRRLVEMIGFTPPPDPPAVVTESSLQRYRQLLEQEYSWCHLTSGGTVANIEALWIARTVRYFPLSIQDVANALDLEMRVEVKPGTWKDLRSLERRELLLLPPRTVLGLVPAYLESVRGKLGSSIEDSKLAEAAWAYLETESQYSVANGISRCLADFPPAIFVSGAAHYSISKALNLLGLGRDALVTVALDSRFRLDLDDLEAKVHEQVDAGRIPLAVVAIAGTTEEGAVDPVHQVVALRDRLESDGVSFWLHIDAAWGGFFRTLLLESVEERFHRVASALVDWLAGPGRLPIAERDREGADAAWIRSEYAPAVVETLQEACSVSPIAPQDAERCERLLRLLATQVKEKDLDQAITTCAELARELAGGGPVSADRLRHATERADPAVRSARAAQDVADTIELELARFDYREMSELFFRTEVRVSFDDPDVVGALESMSEADSVTVDPHKMGYVNYPCGAVAFRNDWVRLLVREKAPYITSMADSRVVHVPPRHLVEPATPSGLGKAGDIATEAFAPYTLEGSRPSFPATALWLNTELLPLDRVNHGAIVRSSWIASRELYEWLVHLDEALGVVDRTRSFEVVTFARKGTDPVPPDTNIVIFGITPKGGTTLDRFNDLTERVYQSFAIRAEAGQRNYSYSQPFFLSKTVFSEPTYPAPALDGFAKAAGIGDFAEAYPRSGIVVLRSTVMNPYLVSLRRMHRQEVLREFVEELAKVSEKASRDLTT